MIIILNTLDSFKNKGNPRCVSLLFPDIELEVVYYVIH